MEKYYVLEQVNATGNGSTTTILLVINPRIENGAIYATKVGIIDTSRSGFDFEHYVFNPVEERDFICIGNATLEEIEEPFKWEQWCDYCHREVLEFQVLTLLFFNI